ncbi:MAG: exonuclease SbcCD subunit D [Acidimicrobiia bacterium]|nr:MAG: exonuclease SbcCD subunit D [Acidimicrobiia bacterium]
MRVLHTSDWHVGKKLGRYDRSDEHREVIDEVVGIADSEDVDLVLHSGDLFDRPLPPIDALNIALDGLVGLSRRGQRPVVVIAGNHDSPGFFDALAPFLGTVNVHLVGGIKRPDDGGVLDLATAAGRAVVSAFPFLRQGRSFEVWEPPEEHYKKYADRLRGISEAYSAHASEIAGTDAVTFLMAHFLVGGSKVHGHGAPRGERELHMGEAYAATAEAIPPGPQYVALGHIHAPQRVPGAKVPAEYAGSLLELDFGEAGEQKRVVIVDVEPGLPASVRSVPLEAGRRLLRPRGSWDEILGMDGIHDAYLDLTVDTAGPDPGLAERARDEFDYVVKVRPEYPRAEAERPATDHRTFTEQYHDYYVAGNETEPPEALIEAFTSVLEEVTGAAG